MTQKTDPNNDRIRFLEALYPNAPQNLWLELRCIHPQTGEVRNLWTKLSNQKQRDAVLKQADRLNKEGFGIYFAPCLRSEKKGSASAAALLPALWVDVDCDGDTARRNKALSKLRAFDPAPSFTIDSGGGWHAYWLLDQPLKLETDEDKQKISRIMHGLFSALDGDEGYVKSVASVMRLPGSLNTKPERSNAPVQIVESQHDYRYSLDTFAWLEVKPKPQAEYIGNMKVVTVNGNGHHPLPPRTEQYLISGATNGNRNRELFEAACQMRDAGYSQSDAERDLIARYVADGNGSENPNAREKEARATIASVFAKPARDPIASPQQVARAQVNQLVDRYGQRQDAVDRPSTEEIVQAVEACVHLNPVEWAEQREQFKSITGNGLKISDIDRLYREKKKEVERQHQQEYIDTESYLEIDGKMIYRKETFRGVMEKTVADWSATALYQTCQIDDDGKENHVTVVELKRGTKTKKLEIPGEIFVDDVALRRFIGASAGAQYVVRAGMSKHLVPAIVQLSGEFETHRHYNFMGWMELDGRWVYVTPHDCIAANGKLAEPPSVELDQRLRDYGLKTASWKDSLAAFDAVTKVLPPKLAPALIAYTLLPVLQRFFPSNVTRLAIHLVGTSGSGKSEIASLMSSFYGEFSRDTPPAQWGDTINTVEMLGYPLADTLYWVDDYKDIYADKKTFTRFMQSYSRAMGRGRLTREAKLRYEKPCRGMILSTGETSLEGEMSVAARMMTLEIPPWEKRDPNGKELLQAENLRQHLSSFTAHFASWVAKRLENDDLKSDLITRFTDNMRGYQKQLNALIGKQSNTDRVVKNWATLVSVYQLLRKFVDEVDGDYILPSWQDVIVENVRALREERASEVFLDILGQLIGGGQAVIEDDMRNPRENPSGVTVVGYRDENFVYLLPEIAFKEVNKVQPISFSTTAIGMQLKEDGILLPGKANLSVQKSVRSSVVRLWRLKSDIWGCEGCETCEDGD